MERGNKNRYTAAITVIGLLIIIAAGFRVQPDLIPLAHVKKFTSALNLMKHLAIPALSLYIFKAKVWFLVKTVFI